MCDADGNRLPGVTCSPHGPAPTLGVVTRAMSDPDTPTLPAACREWTYVRLNPLEWVSRAHIPKLSAMAWASDFQLTAEGGRPPYQWALAEGALPPGLDLHPDGRITGIVAAAAELRDHPLVVEVTDADGARAVKPLAMPVRERPNRWLEEAALMGLIHHPEHIPADGFDAMAELMARQGYQLAVPISWGNGRPLYTYASIFEEDSPLGDILTPLKEAFHRHDIRFGMYFGNLDGPQIGEENGAILVFEEAMVRWNPWVFWFDWAVWDGGYALDAIYSMIKTRNPDTLIILNQAQTSRYGLGDWDLLCMEAWGGWGERLWVYWPFRMPYAKAFQMNSWRLLADPGFESTRRLSSDWREYLRLQLALIGEGFIADIDHTPSLTGEMYTFNGRLERLEDSHLMQAHGAMADWASPPDLPPLHTAYTWVRPGPLGDPPWGYNLRSVREPALYLHFTRNARGKTGLPEAGPLTVGPIAERVSGVVWMNRNQPVPFRQEGDQVILSIEGVEPDEISTILKVMYE
jgi:hypothetical protein